MKESKADLLLHPVRMRIIQTMASHGSQTVQKIAERLPDIPQATLYRHLNKLLKGGILTIVEQRQIRGAIEKVYALEAQGANLTPEDMANASRDDHMKYFTTFLAVLMGDYGRYLAQNQLDMIKDGVMYRQANMHLTDEEFQEFLQDLVAVYKKAMDKKPGEGRRARNVSTIIIPAPDK
ncbi:helix-turn-helix domain-containing protein [Aneurinibacillus aneurinilyticus]|nr:helix-turn-helix domain-containing protein [Aneurinibacillus aneurinilyticus]MCI1694120.1 helix-turn-helix domain-containing protein [Aneurinibacillus aneurinilyticus]MED0672426.1 helix-turn-helix domain-containing protein [Aneurinibacillus aneurinilyticus]MED0708144.1 helix-turn-helix domain-containing protein [Aneurinibacillus aneurinilyticus]MED0721503.1 helix-turn-helix domain-containing protein [Aneurinibacillus aneurinilyticus]MED0734029.1 helix-turn-helix domain-containing protein [A